MKYLIAILLVVVLFCDVYSIGLSIGPGLSVKNVVLYMAAMAFALRLVVQGGFKFTLPRLHGAFAVLIMYAVVSVLVVTLIVRFPGYRLVNAVIALKSNLIDQFLFFAVCYYGATTTEDALDLLRWLMGIVVLSSFITVVNTSGLMTIGTMEVSDTGRVQGALGEANQYAAFLATMFPPLLAAYVTSRKLAGKCFWLAGAVATVVSMILTVSRGGILALLVACIWGAFYFRRYLPVRRLALGAVFALTLVLVFAALNGTYGELLHERLIGQTFVNTGGDASSGRAQIWETALTRMMESPWSLLTGFGWFVYESMGFRFITHNAYLLIWFNLGLAGLVSYLLLFGEVLRNAIRATVVASAKVRPHLMGLATGVVGLAIAIFFVNLYSPWSYIWALIGLGTRLAVNELAASRVSHADAAVPSRPESRGVPLRTGWRAGELSRP